LGSQLELDSYQNQAFQHLLFQHLGGRQGGFPLPELGGDALGMPAQFTGHDHLIVNDRDDPVYHLSLTVQAKAEHYQGNGGFVWNNC
jgi:hypothetical protein